MTPEQRESIRRIIRVYLERAEGNKSDIHYSQHRPLTSMNSAPTTTFWTDCSGLVISAFHWADTWSPLKIEDPSGYNYTGYGNTGSILSANRKRRVPLDRKFYVGDMALYGSSLLITKHVTICRKNGRIGSAVWTSHGSEAGPYSTSLRYRSDLLVVVRSEALA